jgi:pilus assembly protein CpaF
MEFWLYDHSTNTRKSIEVAGDKIIIGRDPSCNIVLRSSFVAKRHACIRTKGNQVFVENLGRSGTRVANREVKIGQTIKFDFGDEIQIAQYSLAMIGAGQKRDGLTDNRFLLHNQLMEFEQKVHAELIERLNLRMTSSINKSDANYVAQILTHLEQILEARIGQMAIDLINHTVHTYLHRLVIAEVVRQCQGKVATDYTADQRLLDAKREGAITELVGSMVDMLPLIFDPTTVNEDLALAEESYDDLFEQVVGQIPKGLKAYIVRRTISKDLQDIMFGLGPLQDLLEMANVSEIMVVGKDRIYVEKNGVIQPTTRSFFSNEILLSVIERILAPVGRRVDTSTPLVDARLHDGSRINVIISPLSLVGPCVTIRKFGWIPFTIDDLIDREAISPECATFLQGCIEGRMNIVISGGTGSGKTTLLNTLSAFIRPNERILTIEESAELRLPQPHVVGLEGRPANIEGRGAYTIRELVRNALRMRPDRIIVGEVRGGEALDMLQAMNTGHDGSLSTLHSNNPRDAMTRIETMVLMAVEMPIRAIREQIVSAVDVVVQLTRFADGRRRVTHISEVTEIDRETQVIRLEDIFTLKDSAQSKLRHTGYIPTFAPTMIEKKIIEVGVFL